MKTSNSKIFISTIMGKIEFFLGIAIAVVFFIATVYAIPTGFFITEFPAFLFFLIVDAFAVFLIIHSRGNNKLLKNIKLYSAAIDSDPTGSIPNLAAAMNTSEDVVRDNLRKMISKNYVTNIVISDTSDYISFPNNDPEPDSAASDSASKAKTRRAGNDTPNTSVEMCTVTCEGCGAVNTVAKGQVAECEYCGSAIQG